jgi:hypothetical protein
MADKNKLNQQLETEHELINRKLNWLLSSQSILFAALAFVLGKEVQQAQKVLFFNVVSLLGIAISSLILIGVTMSVTAKVVSWKDYNRSSTVDERQPLGVRNWITVLALAPDVFMPIAFIGAWWWIWKYMGNL